MKNKILKLWLRGCAALGLALLASNLRAQTVTTIGGGAPAAPYSGYQDGPTLQAGFNQPSGLAMDPGGNYLFVADYSNNVVRIITQPGTGTSTTTTFSNSFSPSVTRGISRPISVVVDGATNVYVLNQGNGKNGTLLQFNAVSLGYPTFVATNASRLTNATAMAMDGLNNLYVTVGNNTVLRITPPNAASVVGVITNPGTYLQGITVLDNGQLALSDAGTNSGIWLMNPYASNPFNNVTKLAGFNGTGDNPDNWPVPAADAIFNHPANLAKAGNGVLVVNDNGNNRVKLLNMTSGTVTLLYGVSSNYWGNPNTTTDKYPGWLDGASGILAGYAESRLPYGVVVAPDGSVFTAEDYYHVLRHVTSTGLSAPQPGYPSPFNSLQGIAFDSVGNNLFIANAANNTVQQLDLGNNVTTTFLTAGDGVLNPASVLVDTNENIYVLNQGSSGNGSILGFDNYGNAYGPLVTGLNQPTAFTMDGYGNFFVTEQSSNVLVVYPSGVSSLVATVTNANVSLQGIAIFDDGNIAVSDAGNHVIWTINPITKLVTKLTGQLGVNGTAVGAANFAKLYQPHQLARVGGNQIVAADYGNNRLVLIQRNGTVSTNSLNSSVASIWFGRAGDPVASSSPKFVPMISPYGIAAGNGGEIFTSETYYDDIRGLTGTGLTSPTINPGVPLPIYTAPTGIALNNESTAVFVADPVKNTVSVLNLGNNQTASYLTADKGMNQPVDVALDGGDNLYVLNQGTGGNGSILEFDRFGNLLGTNVSNLSFPIAMTLDSSGDILVAGQSNQGGLVQQFNSGVLNQVPNTTNTVAILTNAGVMVQGIALFDSGTIVVSDSANQVIWQINPVTKAVSLFTGSMGTSGTNFGSPVFAKLNQPHRLVRVAGDLLLAADSGNNRVVVINDAGYITNSLVSTNGMVWFGLPGDPVAAGSAEYVPMVSPVSLAINASGSVFASESYYKDIREMLATGYVPSSSGGGDSGGDTNTLVVSPTLTPNSGYYPMGQTILVSSPNPKVFYTTDGSDPTTNSTPVSIIGNVGQIHWFNTTNDLTWLHVKAFVGHTNSATVSGQPVSINNIGTPTDFNPSLQAGVGSTIVIPVVCNLGTNQQVKSFQLRYEIAPINNKNTPVISALSIMPTNDFVPVASAVQGGVMGSYTVQPYSLGLTNGLVITTGSNIFFQHFAVVAMIEVQVPSIASEGDTYSLNVLFPSATSDGYNAGVPLTPMAPATIVVTNIPYVVGDSASASGSWYNAGTFGDDNLDNSDVNQAFFASSGLRVPYSFSDVYNAMDVYPPDASGFVGGDGQIRFLDWQLILQRSLRLDTNDWSRAWSPGGVLVDVMTNLVVPHLQLTKPDAKANTLASPWNRQALVGGDSVSYAAPGSTVNVPVYVKLQNGATLSGLQFRTLVTPQSGAPAVAGSPQLSLASGVTGPYLQNSFKAAEAAFGWTLGSFDYQSRSSNFLGWVSFTVPATAQSGQAYTVSFANADGSPDLNTQYDFESRSATVTVNAASPPASICPDEWKIHFFGSTTNPAAADNADPDGDGAPNWMEYLTGTDPTSPQSRLQIGISALPSGKNPTPTQLNWLTAPGKAYELQSCENLADGNWTTIAAVSGDGLVTNLADANPPATTRYYRLYVLP